MSNQNIEKLRQLIAGDPILADRLTKTDTEASLVTTLVKIGAEKGLAFSAGELDDWKSGEGSKIELNETQLQAVAGGVAKKPNVSYTSYGSSTLCVFCGASSGTNSY